MKKITILLLAGLALAFSTTSAITEIAYPVDPTWDARYEYRPGRVVVDVKWPEPAVLAIETRTVIDRSAQTIFGVPFKFAGQAWAVDETTAERLSHLANYPSRLNRALRAYDTAAVPALRREITGG